MASAYTWETTFHWFGIIGIAYSVVLIIFLHDKKDHVEQAVKLENYPKERFSANRVGSQFFVAQPGKLGVAK